MRQRWNATRWAPLVAVGLIAAVVGIAAYASDLLGQTELDLVDARFSIRGEREPPKDLVVVDIDDKTFNDLNVQFPFPRSLHGKVVDRLNRGGARAIGYDVQFTEPTKPKEDNALIKAVDRAYGVVLSATEVDKRGGTRVFGGEEVLRQIGGRAGNTVIPQDSDGVNRRLPYEVDGLKAFAVALAEEASGKPVPRSDFDGGPVYIDYAGSPGTIRTVSFSDVVRGKYPKDLFRDAIVVVGASVPSLQDLHQTSVSGEELMAGAEIQANGASTVLRGLPLRGSPAWLDVFLILLLAALPPATSLRLPGVRAGLVALGVGALFAVGAQLAFNAGIVVAVAYPLLALVVATVGTLAVNYLTAAFERERVHDLFSRFVPESVVEEVLAEAGSDLRLGGVEQECTVMFCDLRGFTTFSETLPAERVIEVVNVYLGEMSDAILENGGTLIAYLGDGIMALFGAPIRQEDHADRAVAASREMMGPRLDRFNAWLRDQSLGDGFRMGIGLNTGTVMAGNVGSQRRLEYTAIGDTTNTASRLEGLTKGGDHMLFIAESTKDAMTRPLDDLVMVGEFEVRGREAKLRVWSVPDPVPARDRT